LPAPCKKTDTMARSWIEAKGDAVFELDAIEPNTLLVILENAIKQHFNAEAYEKRNKWIQDGRAELDKRIKEFFNEEVSQ